MVTGPQPGPHEETCGPPRFLGDPRPRAPLSDPGAAYPRAGARAGRWCLPPGLRRRPAPRESNFGAPSRGPRTRCLRFADSIALHRARLASGWLPALAGRGFHPRGPIGLSMWLDPSAHHLPPSKLPWRTTPRITCSATDVGLHARDGPAAVVGNSEHFQTQDGR